MWKWVLVVACCSVTSCSNPTKDSSATVSPSVPVPSQQPSVDKEQAAKAAAAAAKQQAADTEALAVREAALKEQRAKEAMDKNPSAYLDNSQRMISAGELDWVSVELARFEEACERNAPACDRAGKDRWAQLRKDLGKAHFERSTRFLKEKQYDDAYAEVLKGELFTPAEDKLRAEVVAAYGNSRTQAAAAVPAPAK